MKFQMIHENYNVADLSRSLTFYQEALGLTEKKRITADDGSFIIVYVGNDTTDFRLITMRRLMRFTKKWAASVLKTTIWASISSRTRMATGWRLFLPNNTPQVCRISCIRRAAASGRWLLMQQSFFIQVSCKVLLLHITVSSC